MVVVESFRAARNLGEGVVGLVPTMGSLHAGHISLLEEARRGADTVVMSLFVNPLQFEDDSDLARYPRDLQHDLTLAYEAGVDVVFAPAMEEMYPPGHRTRVNVHGTADHMEGAHRPGHFEGVATVVTKLLAGLRPNLAFFGRKDAQQLSVVTRLASDLSIPVEIIGCQLIREPDGLALSSRNVFLDDEGRKIALGLSGGLFAAADLVEEGVRSGGILEGEVRRASPEAQFEYVRLATQEDALPTEEISEPCFLAAALRVGSVRLIDAVFFDVTDGDVHVDRGRRLET